MRHIIIIKSVIHVTFLFLRKELLALLCFACLICRWQGQVQEQGQVQGQECWATVLAEWAAECWECCCCSRMGSLCRTENIYMLRVMDIMKWSCICGRYLQLCYRPHHWMSASPSHVPPQPVGTSKLMHSF